MVKTVEGRITELPIRRNVNVAELEGEVVPMGITSSIHINAVKYMAGSRVIARDLAAARDSKGYPLFRYLLPKLPI